MPTTPGGRWSPADTDDWDLTTDLAAMQVSNESATANAIATASNYKLMTNAQRLALTGASLYEGLRVWTTDTRLEHRYSSGAWTSETAWTNLAMLNSFTSTATPLQYRRTFGRVSIRGSAYRSAAPAGQAVAVLPSTVPATYAQARFYLRPDIAMQVIIDGRDILVFASSGSTTGAGFTFDGLGYDL